MRENKSIILMLLLLTISTMVGCTVGDDKVKIDDYSPIETPNEIPELEDALTEATALDKKNDESNEKDPNRTEIEVVQEKFWTPKYKHLYIEGLSSYFYHEIPSVPGIKEVKYSRVYKENELIEETILDEKMTKEPEAGVAIYGDIETSRNSYQLMCNLIIRAEDTDELSWKFIDGALLVKYRDKNFLLADATGFKFMHYPSFDELMMILKIMGHDESKRDKIKIAYDEVKAGAWTGEANGVYLINDRYGFRMATNYPVDSRDDYKVTLDVDAIYEANKHKAKYVD